MIDLNKKFKNHFNLTKYQINVISDNLGGKPSKAKLFVHDVVYQDNTPVLIGYYEPWFGDIQWFICIFNVSRYHDILDSICVGDKLEVVGSFLDYKSSRYIYIQNCKAIK